MSDSTLGRIFRVTTWGESHGSAVGAVIDGCPAGLSLTSKDIQEMLNRRRPGQSIFTTKRNETDSCTILSGVFDEKTTGTPISVLVKNENQRPGDYQNIAAVFRPGHADYTYHKKYGIRDFRGGGRASARETIGRVIAGAVAEKLLDEFNVKLTAYTTQIGPICVNPEDVDLSQIEKNPLRMPLKDTEEVERYLSSCMEEGDSAGGIIEVRVSGCPAGLGSPVFGKLDAQLAKALMSIGAVKGVELGSGFSSASKKGSENNDTFFVTGNGEMHTKTNHAGGILGGISTGEPICLRVAVKPTPSISRPQKTILESGETAEITIQGRHDPCVVPRAVVVAEAMTAITLADALLVNATARLDSLKKIYTAEKRK